MQQKVILFLMFLFGFSNNALSLDIRKSGAFFEEASNLFPNIATVADMVFEKPNEAFLPSDDEAVIYEIASIDDENILQDTNSVAKAESLIAKVKEQNISSAAPIKKEEKVAGLKLSDFIKPTEFNKPKNTSKSKKSVDRFANIKVSEGEEVLVSSSEPVKTSEPAKPVKKVVIQENKNTKPIENSEKTVAKVDATVSSVSAKIEEAVDDNPFGVIVSKTKTSKKDKKNTISTEKVSPFIKAFSAIKPESSEKTVALKTSQNKSSKKKKSSSVSSETLKKDLHRTYLSGNQYLSAYEDENEEALEEDVDEEINENEEENKEEYQDDEGFEDQKDVEDALEGVGDKNIAVDKVNVKEVKAKLQSTKKSIAAPSGPLKAGTREVLQMKIDFQEGSSAVSGESVNLIRSFAQIAIEQPTNSIEITIPQNVMNNPKKKKLTARRLSIVSNILRNAGISDRQILPVLTDRDEDSFSFRVVSNDAYSKLRISKGADIFGEEENVKEYNVMKW